jgi:magnesium chelatase subunit D
MSALRDGHEVVMVLLTDARANIARDGSPGRAKAMEDARRAARALRALMQTTVMIDTSPRGEPNAKEIAQAMGAKYVPLPAAQAREVAKAVRTERVS